MNSGKLDEELSRMEQIVTDIPSRSILLMNESFATTTERDGSKIARDIIAALTEAGIRVLFVTHLFEYSYSVFEKHQAEALLLRAQRNDDRSRSFLVEEGEPLKTGFGVDLFNTIITDENPV